MLLCIEKERKIMGMILVFTTETINSRVLMLLVKISVHHNLSNSVSTESSCLILAIFALLASAQWVQYFFEGLLVFLCPSDQPL